ncbi:hypothetical protein BOO34_13225 [Vibrio navarrensis]|nr:hypothetical protein [Vibrio navarrensis]
MLEIFEEGQKSRSEFAREEQGLGKARAEEMVLWSCGPVVLWSYGPVVLWPCGPVVLWSCGPVVLWSCGKAKSGTGESKALEKAGTSFLGARLRGKQKRKRRSWGLGPLVLGKEKAGKAGNEIDRD